MTVLDPGATHCRRLVGRTAVVTGGGSGVGLATVRRLAAEGARVVVADLDEDAGAAAAEQVGGLFVATDVTEPAMVEALYDTAYETCGGVDIAFHHPSGPAADGHSILTTGPAAWQRAQQLHLGSVYLCCQAVLPYMRRHGRGSIVNTAGFPTRPGAAAEQISATAARGGVLALSRALGVQFAREGIRVNALVAGPVEHGQHPRAPGERPARIPLGRFARPAEIAATVAFLASDDSSFITASEFLVDGGLAAAGAGAF
ncbi:SDR family oxidoreductase [Kitasatospora sp. NPDC052896]|uniref:SDR family oxidoreductase n=1 Tax=Kitasatospora sp. NPDC052896 TaxID=3364061 RepID=UPI0037CC5741